MSIWRLLGLEKKAPEPSGPAETETVRKIAGRLERMDPDKARYVAGFAYLLGRAARADMHISEVESQMMERLIMERGHLSEQEAVLVVELAKLQSRLYGATEDFLVTKEFKRLATREQLLSVLDCLYAIGSADHSISVEEDFEIRKIANELGLEHPDLIAIRSRYRDHLSFLKKPDVQ